MTEHMTSRRRFLQHAATGICAAGLSRYAAGASKTPPKNVLFLCVDDLRPQLNCYGNTFMSTPNLDRLAARGFVFDNHFASVPTCGASRCSLLTGMRPRTIPALTNEAFLTLPREDTGKPNSLPDLFRRNGYTTVSVGKVSHNPVGRRYAQPKAATNTAGEILRSGPDDHEPELPLAWDRVYGPTGEWGDPWSAFFGYTNGKTRSYTKDKTPAWEAADVPDTGYPDGLIAEAALHELNTLKEGPFFLAVGFYKPHLPFCAPKKYWDLYDRAAIPLPEHPGPPRNVNLSLSLHRNGELTGKYAALNNPEKATEEETRLLRHGYFACVSYVDAQIGKVLDELDRLGMRDNTLVVVWGDHGWHLGDLYVWGKHTTFDFSLRSALILAPPEITTQQRHIPEVMESVDLYPTVADYCGLTPPDGLDGISLRPALESGGTLPKNGACGFWKKGDYIAATLRTREYRVVEWKDRDGKVAQVELYDHREDPYETINIADAHPDTASMLRQRIPAFLG